MDFEQFERELGELKTRLAERDARIEALQNVVSQAATTLAEIKSDTEPSAVLARLQVLLDKASSG